MLRGSRDAVSGLNSTLEYEFTDGEFSSSVLKITNEKVKRRWLYAHSKVEDL